MCFDPLSRWKLPELVLFSSPSEAPAFPTAFSSRLQLLWEACQDQMVCLLTSSTPRLLGLWDLRCGDQLLLAGLSSLCPCLSLSAFPALLAFATPCSSWSFLFCPSLSRGSFPELWTSEWVYEDRASQMALPSAREADTGIETPLHRIRPSDIRF